MVMPTSINTGYGDIYSFDPYNLSWSFDPYVQTPTNYQPLMTYNPYITPNLPSVPGGIGATPMTFTDNTMTGSVVDQFRQILLNQYPGMEPGVRDAFAAFLAGITAPSSYLAMSASDQTTLLSGWGTSTGQTNLAGLYGDLSQYNTTGEWGNYLLQARTYLEGMPDSMVLAYLNQYSGGMYETMTILADGSFVPKPKGEMREDLANYFAMTLASGYDPLTNEALTPAATTEASIYGMPFTDPQSGYVVQKDQFGNVQVVDGPNNETSIWGSPYQEASGYWVQADQFGNVQVVDRPDSTRTPSTYGDPFQLENGFWVQTDQYGDVQVVGTPDTLREPSMWGSPYQEESGFWVRTDQYGNIDVVATPDVGKPPPLYDAPYKDGTGTLWLQKDQYGNVEVVGPVQLPDQADSVYDPPFKDQSGTLWLQKDQYGNVQVVGRVEAGESVYGTPFQVNGLWMQQDQNGNVIPWQGNIPEDVAKQYARTVCANGVCTEYAGNGQVLNQYNDPNAASGYKTVCENGVCTVSNAQGNYITTYSDPSYVTPIQAGQVYARTECTNGVCTEYAQSGQVLNQYPDPDRASGYQKVCENGVCVVSDAMGNFVTSYSDPSWVSPQQQAQQYARTVCANGLCTEYTASGQVLNQYDDPNAGAGYSKVCENGVCTVSNAQGNYVESFPDPAWQNPAQQYQPGAQYDPASGWHYQIGPNNQIIPLWQDQAKYGQNILFDQASGWHYQIGPEGQVVPLWQEEAQYGGIQYDPNTNQYYQLGPQGQFVPIGTPPEEYGQVLWDENLQQYYQLGPEGQYVPVGVPPEEYGGIQFDQATGQYYQVGPQGEIIPLWEAQPTWGETITTPYGVFQMGPGGQMVRIGEVPTGVSQTMPEGWAGWGQEWEQYQEYDPATGTMVTKWRKKPLGWEATLAQGQWANLPGSWLDVGILNRQAAVPQYQTYVPEVVGQMVGGVGPYDLQGGQAATGVTPSGWYENWQQGYNQPGGGYVTYVPSAQQAGSWAPSEQRQMLGWLESGMSGYATPEDYWAEAQKLAPPSGGGMRLSYGYA